MTRIFLMDLNGLTRLIVNQPAPVKDPLETSEWMSIFTALCTMPQDSEIAVRFMTGSGRIALAYLVGRPGRIDIEPGGDVRLYMYARDIIPENDFAKL